MEEVIASWQDTSREITNAMHYLDEYFSKEHPDDKTAISAYKTLKKVAVTIVYICSRMADDRK